MCGLGEYFALPSLYKYIIIKKFYYEFKRIIRFSNRPS